MKKKPRLLTLRKLMKVAAKTETLARQAWEESTTHRISGRLARDPRDVGALSYAIVEHSKNCDAFSTEITESPDTWLLLQISMEQVSYALWEQLWNDAHPDRFGEAWDGQDVDLMSIWREKVRTMITECQQAAILAMTLEEYFARLTAAGDSAEVTEGLAEWISMIRVGATPST